MATTCSEMARLDGRSKRILPDPCVPKASFGCSCSLPHLMLASALSCSLINII